MTRILDLAIDALVWLVHACSHREEDGWFVLALDEEDVP